MVLIFSRGSGRGLEAVHEFTRKGGSPDHHLRSSPLDFGKAVEVFAPLAVDAVLNVVDPAKPDIVDLRDL